MRRQPSLVAVASLVLASVAIASSSETSDVAREDAVAMQKVHMTLSASCFNDCWKIIDKPEKSAEDVENMILLAYASLWHWKERADCEPGNLSVGYWLASRVHALAGQPEMATFFGEKCLAIAQEAELAPFYLGYGYESLARVAVQRGDAAAAASLLAKARQALTNVRAPEERSLLEADLLSLESALPGQ